VKAQQAANGGPAYSSNFKWRPSFYAKSEQLYQTK